MRRRTEGAKYGGSFDALREKIEQGIFPPAKKIPSEKTLAESYTCSRQTVRQALNL